MGAAINKVVKAAVVCVMVKRWSSNGRPLHAGSSFVNFLDDLNETKKNRITKFGYLGHPKNRILTQRTKYSVIWLFGYLVIWVT
jgi:hypothetical protein